MDAPYDDRVAVTDFQNQAFEQPQEPEERPEPSSVRDRLVPAMPGSALWGWIGPLLVTAFGAFLRFYDLANPKAIVFDETYYAKDSLSLTKFGVERVAVDGADKLLLAGNTNIWKHCAAAQADQCASYVVHPPLGKWMIGLGEWIFGATPFGWRFAAALVGSLSILILARVARRMTRSTLLGCLAGLLLSVEALQFVLSRFALLDVFLAFWILAGFACLVVDRDRTRLLLADWHESSPLTDTGPRFGWRPWRLAAGLCLGAACATKWSGVFFLIGFAVMSLVWDAGARRAVGLRRPYFGTLSLDLPTGAVALGVVPAVTYIASWTGWFVSALGYGRNWAQATSAGPVYFVLDTARSWWNYQWMVLGFHTGLETKHPYQSEPWQWPLLLRPVAFYWGENPKGCGGPNCAAAVLGTGTPIIWYGAILALIAMIAWYVATRDWRGGAVLLAFALGWLPWFYYAISDNRTMFQFYAVPMVPFMILALTLAAGLIIGPVSAPPARRVVGASVVGAFTLLALVNFWWLHPVLAGDLITYDEWHRRMLFNSWI
jgi:dolichyl-phosphate-mannose--protein O-mannosyl transferase